MLLFTCYILIRCSLNNHLMQGSMFLFYVEIERCNDINECVNMMKHDDCAHPQILCVQMYSNDDCLKSV